MPECLSAETLRLFIDLQFYLAQVDDVLATWRDTGRGLPPHLRKLLKLDSFLAHR